MLFTALVRGELKEVFTFAPGDKEPAKKTLEHIADDLKEEELSLSGGEVSDGARSSPRTTKKTKRKVGGGGKRRTTKKE